jgi:hypothetical protein
MNNMYAKVLALLLLCFSVIVFAGVLSGSASKFKDDGSGLQKQEPEDPTTLKARARKAKGKGLTKVVFDSPVPIYAETSGVEEASATYLVVIARPTEAASFMLSPDRLMTFQKFEILERLTTPAAGGCCGPQASDLPPELPAPAADEIYVRINGGRAVIEGVDVTQAIELDFKNAHEYLLFLLPDASGVIASVPLGPYGVFEVKGDGLASILNYPHTLDTEIKAKHGGSLARLKLKLKENKNRQ